MLGPHKCIAIFKLLIRHAGGRKTKRVVRSLTLCLSLSLSLPLSLSLCRCACGRLYLASLEKKYRRNSRHYPPLTAEEDPEVQEFLYDPGATLVISGNV